MALQTEQLDTSYFARERAGDFDVIGTPVQRSDARGHVTGRTEFFEDVNPTGLLHLKMRRSERHHALLKHVDHSAALEVPGVVRVLTHADVPTETTGCIVIPQPDDRLKIHSDTQACFFTLDNAALILDVPFGKLRVVGGTVGGGFGGKVDVMVEPIACLAAMATNRPVKFVYSRAEEMQVSSPRAAERIYISDGTVTGI